MKRFFFIPLIIPVVYNLSGFVVIAAGDGVICIDVSERPIAGHDIHTAEGLDISVPALNPGSIVGSALTCEQMLQVAVSYG